MRLFSSGRRGNINVSADRAEEFFRWIAEQEGGPESVDELRARHAVSQERKPILLDALEAWMLAETIDALGNELADLRVELMRDLKIPPFDEP